MCRVRRAHHSPVPFKLVIEDGARGAPNWRIYSILVRLVEAECP